MRNALEWARDNDRVTMLTALYSIGKLVGFAGMFKIAEEVGITLTEEESERFA